jgi:type II secretory ATPase GspE/PulE/Tfp pilus assembly ATPase PilB-like protein
MSNLPPFERATPQDGRIFAQVGKQDVDIRVSFLPTIHGEKSVLRILETKGDQFDLENLGMSPHIANEYRRLLTQPQGIIFVTGPTGSGKTTTMYASLRYIKTNSKGMVNIVSIEDPVEFAMSGFSQTQVNEDAGLTFAKGLRTILRQDPDVIMVGEIRDLETAQIAMQAGLTGHLMLTTVHSDSTTGVFSRLINMGIEPFLLASSASAVLSQRLVRTLCPACRESTGLTDAEAKYLGEAGLDVISDVVFYTSRGCTECFGSGFRGRSLIAELLPVTDQIHHLITAKTPATDVGRVAREAGMKTMLENGLAKAINGVTSIGEVLRVTR